MRTRSASTTTRMVTEGTSRSYVRLPAGHRDDGSDVPSAAVMDDLQGDAGDGLVTGVDDEALYILERGGWWALRVGDREASVTMSEGLPPWRVFGAAVQPLVQLSLHRHGAVAVHASSVEVGGAGLVVAGWSESGK